MSEFRNARFASFAWLGVAPLITCAAHAEAAQSASPATAAAESAGAGAATAGSYASEVPRSDVIDNSTGTALAGTEADDSIPVAQEIEFVVGNSFRVDSGYDERLKSVARVDYYGTRYVDCEHYPLEIHTTRPDRVATLVKTGGSSTFEIRKSGRKIVVRGVPQGMPVEAERALLETFDFDTPVIDLKKRPPTIKPVGMQKLPRMLTWKFEAEPTGEYHRVLYVDSHFGDLVKYTVRKAGVPLLDVVLHDYRVVDGIRVAFAIDYLKPDGTLLANDRLERVSVTRTRS